MKFVGFDKRFKWEVIGYDIMGISGWICIWKYRFLGIKIRGLVFDLSMIDL